MPSIMRTLSSYPKERSIVFDLKQFISRVRGQTVVIPVKYNESYKEIANLIATKSYRNITKRKFYLPCGQQECFTEEMTFELVLVG